MLSADQMREIVFAYHGTEASLKDRNRRCPRIVHNAKMTIYRLGRPASEAALDVLMRDISARGCSFTASERLVRDSNFVIRFARRSGPPTNVLCTVMHCRSMGSVYRVGAEFTCLVDACRTNRLADSAAELDRIRGSILG